MSYLDWLKYTQIWGQNYNRRSGISFLKFIKARAMYGGPALSLDFLREQVLPASITFTRAAVTTGATYIGSDGLIKTTTAADFPRFGYDPITLAPRGLLIEPARTNLIVDSQYVDINSYYFHTMDYLGNIGTGPDGVENSAGVFMEYEVGSFAPLVQQSYTRTAGVKTFTFSVYAKKIGSLSRYLYLEARSSGTIYSRVWFNLANGTASATSNLGGWSSTATISLASNGYYRCSLTFTTDAASTTTHLRIGLTDTSGSIAAFTNVATEGFYAYGEQLEEADSLSSLIITATAAKTRAADVVTMPTTGWWSSTEGTMLARVNNSSVNGGGSSQVFFSVHDNAFTNIFSLFRSGPYVWTAIWKAGILKGMHNQVIADPLKAALTAHDTNDVNATVINGVASSILAHSAGMSNGCTKLNIGSDASNTNQLNGYLSHLSYWPTCFSSSRLQALTS